jgi:ABC-2 type transport system ATP-binding protein
MPEPVIAVSDLRMRYGDFEAVRGIDLDVQPGEAFALLGPNGAGKTTTVEILEGLRQRTAGDVRVLGFDPGVQANEVKQRIGVCLQSTNLYEKLTVAEALALFSALYRRTSDSNKLLERLQLSEKRNAYYSTLSGGQKQRLAIALAMINDPDLVFLDEPTTGLDPQVRLEIHTLIEDLKSSKRTILLTTHYIEEAERLCDRVAIIDEGRIVAMGSPRDIKAKTLGHSRIEATVGKSVAREDIPPLPGAENLVLSADGLRMTVQSSRPASTVVELVKWIDARGLELADIHLQRPTLEDAFIELTGKRLRD